MECDVPPDANAFVQKENKYILYIYKYMGASYKKPFSISVSQEVVLTYIYKKLVIKKY